MHSDLLYSENYISESFYPPGEQHNGYSIALSNILGLAINRGNGCKYATSNRGVEHSFKRAFDFNRQVQLFGMIIFLLPHPSFILASLDAERHPLVIFNFG